MMNLEEETSITIFGLYYSLEPPSVTLPVLAAHRERLLREDVLLVGLAERALLQVERLPQLDVHRRVAAARSELWKRKI